MPYHHFMLADVLAIGTAFLVYTLFLFVPGYVLSWALDLLDFRRQTLFVKSITAISVSCALSPVLAYLLWTFSSLLVVWVFFAALWAGFLFLLLRRLLRGGRSPLGMNRSSWKIVLLACAWVLLALFSLVDLQFDQRLYRSVTDFDHCMRTAIVSAISRSGLPPHSPFFYPGHPVMLRSHYFWLVLSSLVQLLGHGYLTARDGMLASCLWCGVVLLATICLYLRFFFEKPRLQPQADNPSAGPPGWQRKAVIAGALVAVTGLDILPTIYLYYSQRAIYPDMEWWNEQVTSWFDSMLWVPHHVAALLAALTGFLILFRGVGPNINRNVMLAVVAGLSFACCTGGSVYVGFVFALFAMCWCVVLGVTRSWRELGSLLLAGLVAVGCLLPFVTEVSSVASGGGFIEFRVRGFTPVDTFLLNHRFAHPWIVTPGMVAFAHLFFLPINYLIEFGFFFLAVAWKLRRHIKHRWRGDRPGLCASVMLAIGLLVSMFLRSATYSNNDLGWRSCLLVQFVALLWGADFVLALFSRGRLGVGCAATKMARFFSRPAAVLTIVLGIVASGYQVVLLRYYAPLVDAKILPAVEWLAPDYDSGKRGYAMREAYEVLAANTPRNTIEQHDPAMSYNDPFWGLYGDRQAVASDYSCDTAFGGTAGACSAIVQPLMYLFRRPELNIADVLSTCRQFGIDVLVVRDRDPVWRVKNSWVWTSRPIFGNGYARVFSCR